MNKRGLKDDKVNNVSDFHTRVLGFDSYTDLDYFSFDQSSTGLSRKSNEESFNSLYTFL